MSVDPSRLNAHRAAQRHSLIPEREASSPGWSGAGRGRLEEQALGGPQGWGGGGVGVSTLGRAGPPQLQPGLGAAQSPSPDKASDLCVHSRSRAIHSSSPSGARELAPPSGERAESPGGGRLCSHPGWATPLQGGPSASESLGVLS